MPSPKPPEKSAGTPSTATGRSALLCTAERTSDSPLFVGVDTGGTSTRCVVATLDGAPVGYGRGPGGNQWSSGGGWADSLGAVLAQALDGLDPGRVRGGHIGMAGIAGPARARAQTMVDAAWSAQGLTGQAGLGPDITVGFAAGSAEAEGLLLLAGTGAVAAWVRDGELVHRCDGFGWWLGDEGSAVWLGRAALRNVLYALDGRGAATGLTARVARVMLGEEVPEHPQELAAALVTQVYAAAPATVGRLAPQVQYAAEAGDEVAAGILAEAADRLLASLRAAHRAAGERRLPVVLAGSVLTTAGPLSATVRAAVAEQYQVEPALARSGVAGATALALRAAGLDLERLREVHAELLRRCEPLESLAGG